MRASTTKILQAARRCFFQHGYSSTTVSLISKYAEVSRVTIHKQFCSKERIFKKVLEHYLVESKDQMTEILASHSDCWSMINALMNNWLDEVFKEISDDITRNDLIYSARKHCKDVLIELRDSECLAIEQALAQGVKDKQVDLSRINMTCAELADLLETSFGGIINTHKDGDPSLFVSSLLKIYQEATRPI